MTKVEDEMKQFTKKHLFLLILIPLVILGATQAQEKKEKPKEFKLTIDNIMEGPELVGNSPSNILWSVDGKKLYFRWQKPGEKSVELYALSKTELTPQKVTVDDLLKLPPVPPRFYSRFAGFGFPGMETKFDRAQKRALLVRGGDISLLDISSGKMTELITTDERESNANFTFDQEKIYFTTEGNLFLLSLQGRSLRQMTSFSKKTPPPSKKADEVEKWYSDQQKELFQEFSRTEQRMGQRGMFAPLGSQIRRKPFYLSEEQDVVSLDLSPDEKYVVFRISEKVPQAKTTIVPNYVTRTGYTETIESHTKAAQSSNEYKAGIMSVSNGEVKWVDYNQGDRKISPSSFFWSPDGKKCALTASAEDRKDEWLWLLDLESGKTTVVENVHDDAWVGELGLTNIVWSPDSQSIYYLSEKDGFAHLYRASLDGKEKAKLTNGRFEVYAAQLSKDGKRWYLSSNEEHPGEHHFYSMSVEGGKRTKITSMTGHNEVFLSPDESSLAILYSSSNKPPELYIQPNTPGAEASKLTISTTEGFRSYPWYEPQVISFKARDGFDVYCRLYRPKNWHAQRPAVIFIHGAGYLQNATKGWSSSYSREYLFNNFLIQNGYLVLEVDYRGSAGYGRDCRVAIYRHMGGKDLDDIVDATSYLVKELNVNAERIGLYGGSYGGFLILMAMFKAPEKFKAGAALRPVSDWAHYHPGYTVDILNLPQKDSEAYKQSSPIYFAEGLKGALLICHGMVDTNVHFQDTVRLVQRLIELRKENWEVAFYPVENHTFHNSSSWADEYKRIFKLFEQNLK
jgi:dipeptidyl aminopeptidase/acylaminoacyl peptidase